MQNNAFRNLSIWEVSEQTAKAHISVSALVQDQSAGSCAASSTGGQMPCDGRIYVSVCS